jgi:hypothetical protein
MPLINTRGAASIKGFGFAGFSPTVPFAPSIGSASTTGATTASVSFTAGCSGGLPITGYQAISSPGCITATGSSSPISVSGLTHSTSYTFKVRAQNSLGYGPYSGSSNSITTNNVVPSAPTGVSATATSCSAISVSFTGSSCNGGASIDYYQVVCTSSGSHSATGSSPISITGLSSSTSYTFHVRAHNSVGYSCYSGNASATTNAPRNTASHTISANSIPVTFCVSCTTAFPGYVAGSTDVTITVNPGVYIYSIPSTGALSPAVTITGGTTGDTVTLVNKGYIMGQGGGGQGNYYSYTKTGGTAIKIGFPTTIDNTYSNAYIGGGGGGGGHYGSNAYGGGGAGGGHGGVNFAGVPGGSGGVPGSFGGDGSLTTICYCGCLDYWSSGGGGGGQFPGTGGAGATGVYVARGGTAGGGGGGGQAIGCGAAGGSGNSAGGSTTSGGGGGGGGWGASGGSGGAAGYSGGKAVCLNGYSVTWVGGNTSRVYGAVS